jgi:hypothetical protein
MNECLTASFTSQPGEHDLVHVVGTDGTETH